MNNFLKKRKHYLNNENMLFKILSLYMCALTPLHSYMEGQEQWHQNIFFDFFEIDLKYESKKYTGQSTGRYTKIFRCLSNQLVNNFRTKHHRYNDKALA